MRRTVTVVIFWFFANGVCLPTNAFFGQKPMTASSVATRGYSGGVMFDGRQSILSTRLGLIPPPGSGYAGPEEEVDAMPSSYEPMMEYPGTMRPGRTPENMPFHDLPIGDDDPDPVPWPHFQQIEACQYPMHPILSSCIRVALSDSALSQMTYSGITDGNHRTLTQYQWRTSSNNRADGTYDVNKFKQLGRVYSCPQTHAN